MIYTFRNPQGEAVELAMTVAEYARLVSDGVYVRDGVPLTRDYALDASTLGGHRPSCWPMKSDAVGVCPHQIGEAREYLAARGVETEFTSDGRAVFRDRKHRSAHCKAWGVKDLDGGYGDNCGQ